MASSLEVTRVVSPCGAVPNERKRRTAVERGKKSVVFRSERGWGMMKGVKLGLFDNLKTREFVQQILLILNPSELIFSTLLVAVFLLIV